MVGNEIPLPLVLFYLFDCRETRRRSVLDILGCFRSCWGWVGKGVEEREGSCRGVTYGDFLLFFSLFFSLFSFGSLLHFMVLHSPL